MPALGAALAAITAAAYGTSFGGVFVFDDVQWIVENEAIRQAWPPWRAAGGSLRPVLFWTLALNYALSGLETWSYHAVNLLIHAGAALTLFGLMRRVSSVWLAWSAALVWAVHPLQTQAVTYIIQRGESLAGLLLLLVLYCAHRGAEADRARNWWYGAAAAAFYLGLGTKEVMIVALPVLWVYDRLFAAGSFAAALRLRRGLYAALAGPLILGGLLSLVARPGLIPALVRGDAVDVTRWEYLLSQPGVLLHYLRLTVWPFPQYLDYGWTPPASWVGIALPLLVVSGLLAATALAVRRGERLGFAGAWFFLILAPTSSLVPLKDLLVEHRMYLPSAAAVVLAVLGAGEALRRLDLPEARRRAVAGLALAAVTLSLGAATWQRNLDYHSELGIWGSAAADRGDSAKRFYNLGLRFLLEDRGLLEPATFAVSVDTSGLDEAGRRGVELLQAGDMPGASAAFERVLRADPANATALTGAGIARYLSGDPSGARQWLTRVAQLRPQDGAAHTNLSCALLAAGDTAAAWSHASRAAVLAPGSAEARHNAGTMGVLTGQWEAGRVNLQEALRLRPHFAAARNNLGAVLAAMGDLPAALAEYESAVRAGSSAANANAGLLLLDLHRRDEAARYLAVSAEGVEHRQLALKGLCLIEYSRGQLDRALEHGLGAVNANPRDPESHNNVANCYLAQGDTSRALDFYRGALTLDPRRTGVHENLARALFALGRAEEAAGHLELALELDPADESLRADLAVARQAAGN